MALLSQELENTTVTIGVKSGDNVAWIGTGFIVAKKSKISDKVYLYLITNKHVVGNSKVLLVRLQYKNGNIVPTRLEIERDGIKTYTEHPIKDIDIVAISLNYDFIINNMNQISAFILDENTYTVDEYLSDGGFEGSPVFMLGYPMGKVDDYSTTPICRKGCIARFKKKEIEVKYNFILDIQNFPGNSGSPIITCPELIAVSNSNFITEIKLLGIVHSYYPYEETLVNTQTNEIVEIRSENSGLALAHPVDYIKETVLLDLKKNGLK